jgi:hypothetical protein
MQDRANELPRIPLPRNPVNKGNKKKRRARAYSSSGPSWEISAITLAPPELFYALLRDRYLALLGLWTITATAQP